MGNPPIYFEESMTENQIIRANNKYNHNNDLWEIQSKSNTELNNKIQDAIKQI